MKHLIDIGINLTNKQFYYDQKEVIRRALEGNVKRMILTGTSLKGSHDSLCIAKKHPNTLFSTAGIHPHDSRNFTDETLSQLRDLAKEKEVVAIGECGLDFNRDFSPRNIQEIVFEKQLQLARETGLPLFLHERDAHQRFVEIMTSGYQDLISSSVVHCFTGSSEEVLEYVELGFYIGVTGWICDDKRGKSLQEAVKHIPLKRLMIETDSPYLLPKNVYPKPKRARNEPSFLPHIAETIAKYKECTVEEVIKHSTQNAQIFFNLPTV